MGVNIGGHDLWDVSSHHTHPQDGQPVARPEMTGNGGTPPGGWSMEMGTGGEDGMRHYQGGEGVVGIEREHTFIQPGEEDYSVKNPITGKTFGSQEAAQRYHEGAMETALGRGGSSGTSKGHYTDEQGYIRNYEPGEISAYKTKGKGMSGIQPSMRTTETPYSEDEAGNRGPGAGPMMTGTAYMGESPRHMESVYNPGQGEFAAAGSRLAVPSAASGSAVGPDLAKRNAEPKATDMPEPTMAPEEESRKK